MKTKDYMNELNAKSVDELQNELVAAKKELFNLRFQNATNQLENTSRIKDVRNNDCLVHLVTCNDTYTCFSQISFHNIFLLLR